jgi:metallophosphoesterase superfamily enzyme
VDQSLFTFHTAKVHIFHLVYADDIVITGNDDNTVSGLIEKLKGDFAMKDLGPLLIFHGYSSHMRYHWSSPSSI